MSQHEQELLELFNKVTVPVPGSTEIHAINLDGFKRAIDWAMEKAYLLGQQEGLNKASAIVSETFNHHTV